MSLKRIASALQVKMTGCNWRTVMKLQELVASIG
jgi:hypothetical protein